jgi:hypothetical protein
MVEEGATEYRVGQPSYETVTNANLYCGYASVNPNPGSGATASGMPARK